MRHRKRSGIAAQGRREADGQASLSALGNRYKMQTMHPRAEIAGVIAAQSARQAEHIATTLRGLDAAR
ncbi:MAG: hypothetical protein EOM69_11160 [Clostridia bacterium]|nr:hypothetical protein [Clostridia bacterium]